MQLRKAVAAFCATAMLAVALPSSSGAAAYWGAYIGNHLTGTEAPWDMNAVTRFESNAGKKLSILNFGSPFANCYSSPCSYYSFPTTPFNDIRARGSIPMLSWSSQSLPSSLNQPNYQLADVISGAHDSYIRSFATKARDWGKPFFMRFNWEMNGNWFSWSEGVNGNQAGEFVKAWRHVVDIFRSVGARNATWVWCPYVDPSNKLHDLASLYPGDAYVDWTCLDGFNWGTNPNAPAGSGWRSFDRLFSSTYSQITGTIAPAKPMMVGEVGSTESGGSKAGWITNMFGWLPTNYPKIRALTYFDKYDGGMDWPIESSAAATNAFSKGIRDPGYTTNSYSKLTASPIPAP